MEHERSIAVKYLEKMQERYHQTPTLKHKDELKKMFDSEDFWRPVYERTVTKDYPESFESYFSRLKANSFVDELIADTDYQNPNWAHLISSLLSDLKPAINERYGEYTGSYLFGSITLGQVNGFAVKVPNSSYKLIVLSDGVFAFCHLLTKAISPIFYEGKEQIREFIVEKNTVLNNLMQLPSVCDRVLELIMAYAIHANPFNARQYAADTVYTFNIHEALRDAMETFILGHEFGHILKGHLDGNEFIPDNENRIITSHLQEFEADNVGLVLGIAVSDRKGIASAIGFAGADFFFSSMRFFQECLSLLKSGKIEQEDLYGTHPSFGDRKAFLRPALVNLESSEVDDMLDFAHTLELVLDSIRQKLESTLLLSYKRGVKTNILWR